MTSGSAARARRRGEQETPLPPALRAELRGRVQEAAKFRDGILAEAKRQKRTAEVEAARQYDRVRASVQAQFERERDAIRDEIHARAGRA